MELQLSTVERIVLLLLIAASVFGFWTRFRVVLRRVLAARSEPGYTVAPIGRRVWDFFAEVLCQAKVIRQRPLPGIAHALVFWGFVVFALITLNHFAAAFGLAFMSRNAGLGRIYYWFVAVLAIAVAIGIAGLAFRRFIVRPRWLGEVSPESGVIAALIFLLMVTYLAAFRWPEGTVTGRLLWWAHAILILSFLPLIPHTKHLHLLLSPITIFLKRPQFSQIPPLKGDEDFGLVTGRDLTNVTALQVYTCVECGRCTEHCPAHFTGKLLNPKQIALGTRHYLNDFGPASEEPLIGRHLALEAVFQCTTCGSCEFQCPVGIQHLPLMIGLRRGAVNTGKWEDEHGTKLFLNLERNGNALGFASGERDKFVAKAELPIFDGSQEYCLWLGCMGAYDPGGREIISAFAEVMRGLGTSFGVLRRERCTGDPARRLGNDLAFGELAQAGLEGFRQSGVKKIVSICPHCVRTMSVDWREYGEAPPIEHHTEFLARHADKLPRDGSTSVVYHDPCYLGRYRGVYDAPRDVLSAVARPVDPPRARERSFCCGAGGGLAFLGEEKGRRVSVERAEELARTGAEVVGAACPFCNTMFRDALSGLGEKAPKLLDIAQIVAGAMRDQGKA
ncbi:MAG TPA: heterodisulfide reductase-related iron-sulfur binding cluster [Bryobacteraceae bacterium]|nr:heterodisulfide reductase-related iron-sulfur binding cluster [Bryobacteraceae bacterium]